MLDLANTIKVSQDRVAIALSRALSQFDASMPGLMATAAILDARIEELYKNCMQSYNDRMAERARRIEVWHNYREDCKAYRTSLENRKWRSPPLGNPPIEPDVTDADYDYYGTTPPRPVLETATNVYALNKLRSGLKSRRDIALLAIAPYRVSYTEAAFIAACENGEYVEKLKDAAVWKSEAGRFN